MTEVPAELVAQIEDAVVRPVCQNPLAAVNGTVCMATARHTHSCLGCGNITFLCCRHSNELVEVMIEIAQSGDFDDMPQCQCDAMISASIVVPMVDHDN